VPAGSLGIASREEVRSVILLTRRPPGDLERVAVDSNSRTSVALLRLVLARLYGCRPRFEAMEPDSSRMLASHGAALLIGDAALRASRDGVEALDLAAAWHRMTGLPFVFALWGARDARMAAATADLLERSLPIGLERIRAGALAGAAAKAGVDEAEVLSYLTRNIHYRLGPEEQESLSIYLALCREEGVLEGAVSA
jgi:chorismate dehydratase